ncbi:hypothetical protein EJ05DRAFT_498752 [Pseudovirgaria hyperparasitica]|uniref:Uncharacterized protein n=1 Tax=Pseudovirgaria hyperparasitica TaxID=470096 RepID=A0A6A6WA42_9PEZI|nr:uncharacterized protein EJ05DRAFT_498752 [Pseudovirgaria hyperparasitica]KAF2759543.1 hypothetical protein EJ05DRAFT_498752 [Pseudovirgaria hyperparasitica]
MRDFLKGREYLIGVIAIIASCLGAALLYWWSKRLSISAPAPRHNVFRAEGGPDEDIELAVLESSAAAVDTSQQASSTLTQTHKYGSTEMPSNTVISTISFQPAAMAARYSKAKDQAMLSRCLPLGDIR